MDIELLTITADNVLWAVNENFKRVHEALKYKVPLNGKVVLKGNWDFGGSYTMFGVVPAGTNTAIPLSGSQLFHMVTEDDDHMETEDGDLMITEGSYG